MTRPGEEDVHRSAHRCTDVPRPMKGAKVLVYTTRVAVAASLALCSYAPLARAQSGDGAYGRLVGDLTLDLEVGGGLAAEPAAVGSAFTALRARYLDVSGFMVAAEWRPEGRSRLVWGVDLRPLFLVRFLTHRSLGDRTLDLLIDSVGFELGVALVDAGPDPGLAFSVGFGAELPLLAWGEGAEGLFLRASGRHVAALATDAFGPGNSVHDWVGLLGLVVRGQAHIGLAEWEPPRYRATSR